MRKSNDGQKHVYLAINLLCGSRKIIVLQGLLFRISMLSIVCEKINVKVRRVFYGCRNVQKCVINF